MTTRAEEIGLTVDELAARAGVTVRTVRFYSTRGLLPPPEIGPRRVGRYGAEHLSRLALIEELQHQGLTLAAIERYLRRLPEDLSPHDLAIHRAVVSSWTPDEPEETTLRELERRAGRPLTEDDLDRLTAMGALTRPAADGPLHIDPGLLSLGLQLLDVPWPPDTLVAARTILLRHARATARELTRLFHDEANAPDVAAMKSLSAHMQPLVVQALVTAFQRSLKEELRELYEREGAPSAGRAAGTD
ncbi:transcriptional regulator [Streptomyces griseocarneus]|nr:transcriptional regulator [Streptomyces griseocarneus]